MQLMISVKAYFDGHRIAYADRHRDHGAVRTFCKNTFEIPIGDLLTEATRKRADPSAHTPCQACADEIARLERLRHSDPVGYQREVEKLFAEGRAQSNPTTQERP